MYKSSGDECKFSKKQKDFLMKHMLNKNEFDVVDLKENPNKEAVGDQVTGSEDEKAALSKDTAEKKAPLEEKPAEEGQTAAPNTN